MTAASGINLLPPEAKARVAHRRFNLWLVKIGVLLLAVQLAAVVIFMAWRNTANEARALMDHQVASLRVNLQSFDDLRQEALLIADRSAAYQAITGTLIDWSAVLDDLGKSTPADVSLTSFQMLRGADGVKFTMTGGAGSRASIIAFRQTLEATKSFANVEFETSQLADPQTKRVSFTLSAALETPGAAR